MNESEEGSTARCPQGQREWSPVHIYEHPCYVACFFIKAEFQRHRRFGAGTTRKDYNRGGPTLPLPGHQGDLCPCLRPVSERSKFTNYIHRRFRTWKRGMFVASQNPSSKLVMVEVLIRNRCRIRHPHGKKCDRKKLAETNDVPI